MTIPEEIAAICFRALCNGNKIMFAGNGGSAADAQHLAAELVGKLNFDRPPLAALALTTDTSILTAIGNDYGFEYVFSRQIQALGKAGDVLIAMSTSGNSSNIIKAIRVARDRQIITVAKAGGNGGIARNEADYIFSADSLDTQAIQEQHMRWGHKYCGLIEKMAFPQ